MNKISQINLMEVCGTHTMSIARNGLRKRFPDGVKMLSGPGCPVCVTPTEDIDKAIALSKINGIVIITFGDMLHVPGSCSSLMEERAKGADIRMTYSAADALETARANPEKNIVFLGVGFETTAPTIAAEIVRAKKDNVKNFFVLCMFKTIPMALESILAIKQRKIDGFLLPGHVSAIIGTKPYAFLAKKYNVPAVIAGFEAADILDSVRLLEKMIRDGKPAIVNSYSRAVKPEGNLTAQKFIHEVFELSASNWRAIGSIKHSGLVLRKKYSSFDALKKFKIKKINPVEPKGCKCGNILLGLLTPRQCRLFGKTCTPAHPVGPCMVSSEGACAAAFKYGEF